MRRLTIVLFALVFLGTTGAHSATGAMGPDDRPRTFRECVKVGGRLAIREGWITCAHTVTETERVYGTVATGTGETVPVELVTESVVHIETFLFFPQRTVERTSPAKVVSCVSGEEEGTPSPCPAT